MGNGRWETPFLGPVVLKTRSSWHEASMMRYGRMLDDFASSTIHVFLFATEERSNDGYLRASDQARSNKDHTTAVLVTG